MLISVGADRRACEYDLQGSTLDTGMLLQIGAGQEGKVQRRESMSRVGTRKASIAVVRNEIIETVEPVQIPVIEVTARPTSLMWHPKMSENDNEEKFVVANTEYKFKELNVQSKQCRKTTLAPMFSNYFDSNYQNNFDSNPSPPSSSSSSSSSIVSNPPSKLLPIRVKGKTTHYAYSCPERVVGVGYLPLRGDPTEVSHRIVSLHSLHYCTSHPPPILLHRNPNCPAVPAALR
jgi:hypothetical protein